MLCRGVLLLQYWSAAVTRLQLHAAGVLTCAFLCGTHGGPLSSGSQVAHVCTLQHFLLLTNKSSLWL